MPKASQRLLDDSAFDVEAWLAGRIAARSDRSRASLRALSAARLEAAAKGQPLRLSVAQDNPAARRLYARMGFVPVEDLGTHLVMDWRVSSG